MPVRQTIIVQTIADEARQAFEVDPLNQNPPTTGSPGTITGTTADGSALFLLIL